MIALNYDFLKWLITQEASQVYCTILTNFKQDIKTIDAHLQPKNRRHHG